MKKIMCFGTFDKLHQGHLSYFEQSKRCGSYLIVVVALDKNVERIKSKKPIQNEKTRLNNVKKIALVDKAIFGQIRNKFNIIKKYSPDVICLGYDQKVELEKLKNIFKKQIIRLKPHKPEIYKSSLL